VLDEWSIPENMPLENEREEITLHSGAVLLFQETGAPIDGIDMNIAKQFKRGTEDAVL
jgi:hypothetical protein